MLLIPYFVAFLKGDDDELARTAQRSRERVPPRKTTSRTWRRWPWLAPASCRTRDGRPRSPSRSRERVGSTANGPACSKRPERCGKRFTGMRPPPGRAPARRSRLDRGRDVDYAAAFALALAGDLPQSRAPRRGSRARVPGGYVRSVHVSADASGPVLVERVTIRQRRFRRCRPPRATISPSAASASSDASAACIPSTFAEWPTSPPVNPPKPPPSSSGFSIIAASCSSIPWTRWRACSWHERSRSRATRRRRRAAYEDLLTLWKNADAKIPMVEQARAEYARLRLELELQRQLRRASGLAILAAERAVGPVREIRTADLIASRIGGAAAQELLQRVAVGDVQETESDLEPGLPSANHRPIRAFHCARGGA